MRQELLSYEIVVEEMGGETQDVEVSALKKTGLDKLEEAILLQAEILDLQANPDRAAEGSVIESRLDRGRGPVGTILVQRGTLQQGDIVVAGAEWGRVRAMLDDKGKPIAEAGPVDAGGNPRPERRAVRRRAVRGRRERRPGPRNHRVPRSAGSATRPPGVQAGARGTLDQMLARIQAGVQKEVAVLIKADVQGSAEAIQATVLKLAHEEVKVRVLLAGVGQITESDVQLAKASSAVIIAFNVRATSQARELAQREGVDIRYFSIIYEVSDDVEKLVQGKVAPKAREKFLGYAEVRKVFNITKTGKVAGCMITEGLVKRGAGVRVLRDNVVIHKRRAVAAQALQGRCARSGARLRMRPVVRQLPRSAGRRRGRVLRNGDGSGLKKRDAGPTQRQLRVAEEIRHVLAGMFERRDFRDPDLAEAHITVTEVRMSPDLKHATAFVSRLGRSDVDALLPALKRAAPWLRSQVAHAVPLRYTPELSFQPDHALDYATKIDRLMHAPEVARDLEE